MYITFEEYNAVFSAPAEAEFDLLLPVAEAIVNHVTGGKIDALLSGHEFSEFRSSVQTAIKNATIYQVNIIYANGGQSAGTKERATDVKIDDFHYKYGSGDGQVKYYKGQPISAMVEIYLDPTGLLNPACNRGWSINDFGY